MSIHAQPRATQDMDIFVSPDQGNMEAVYGQDLADAQAIRRAQQQKPKA